MTKIIGMLIFLIGLTASVLEIYSFVTESPWFLQQFDKFMTNNEDASNVQAKVNSPIHEPSSNKLLITEREIDVDKWKKHIQAKANSPIHEPSSNKLLITDRTIDVDKWKKHIQATKNSNEPLAISHPVSNQPIDFEKLKQNLPPIDDQD